jgi:peptidoglycan/xylan/chitin deacetylase (PgdA/CDA1 family)
MHVPAFGRSLKLPLTLDDLEKPGFVTARADGAATLLRTDPTRPAAGAAASSVAITFDDGPHPEGTPRILEVLAEFDAKATFFLVGEQVVKRPALARQIVTMGHTVGLHGYVHRPNPTRRSRAMLYDFEHGIAAIADATGVEPKLHRPPYGIYSPASLRMARERGLQPLLWSKWGKDWRKVATPEQIAYRVTDGLQAGDVILLHDADYYSAKRSHRRTAAALPKIIKTLQSAELGTVTFS